MTGRGLVGRRSARAILVLSVGLDAFVGVPFLAAPLSRGPMFDVPPAVPIGWIASALGVALNVLGLIWMVRILRADPESHQSSWRAIRGR